MSNFDFINFEKESLGIDYVTSSSYGEKIYQKSFGRFKKINIFIGANNSGKSKMVRNIISQFLKKKNV